MDDSPQSMDEACERTLMAIDTENRVYAKRLFHCLAVSIRPLRIEELAEVLAISSVMESTPEFNIGLRPADPVAFILAACSTLGSSSSTLMASK